MNMNELLNTININDKKILKNHPKMILFLKYINENNCDIYEHDFAINAKAFQILLETINSFSTLLEILKKSADLLSINFNPKQMANFYNLYNPNIIQYSKDAEILMDQEYLKYTSIKWTEEKFLNLNKVLYITNNRIILKNNPHNPNDYKYIESYLLNLVSLKKAKDLNLMKQALIKLINSCEL